MRLNRRANGGHDSSPEEPPKAVGKLEGALPVDRVGVGLLGDPDEKVSVGPKTAVDLRGIIARGKDGLSDQVSGEVDATVEDLVGPSIGARGGASCSQDGPCDLLEGGRGPGGELSRPPCGVGGQDGGALLRVRVNGSPDVSAAGPQDILD